MLKKINLQLFAEDDEIDVEDIELEEESIDFEPESEEELELDDEEEEKKEEKPAKQKKEEKPAKQKKNDVVPKKALMAERKKFQKQIAELKKQMDNTGSKPDVALETLVNEGGIDESVAKAIAKLVNKTNSKAETVEGKVSRALRDIEFERLNEKPEYADIEEFRDEIEEMADKTGLSLKQCYNALFAEDKQREMSKRLKDLEDEKNSPKGEYKAINTINNGTPDVKSSKYKLTKDQLDMAKAVGMTAREYYVFLKGKSVDHFKKLKKG